jgi:hypothetical protein
MAARTGIDGCTYLFWSSWRRQTKKEGWNLQDCGVLSDGKYFALHRRHTLDAAAAAAVAVAFAFAAVSFSIAPSSSFVFLIIFSSSTNKSIAVFFFFFESRTCITQTVVRIQQPKA